LACRLQQRSHASDWMIKVGLCGFTIAMADYPLYFPVVEVQQTFYEPPADATMQRRLAATPAGFELTIKAWQLMTHEGNLWEPRGPTWSRNASLARDLCRELDLVYVAIRS
jgi:uncharacterized protein YecE (DUF72 family)